jgi:hypothetical protein
MIFGSQVFISTLTAMTLFLFGRAIYIAPTYQSSVLVINQHRSAIHTALIALVFTTVLVVVFTQGIAPKRLVSPLLWFHWACDASFVVLLCFAYYYNGLKSDAHSLVAVVGTIIMSLALLTGLILLWQI